MLAFKPRIYLQCMAYILDTCTKINLTVQPEATQSKPQNVISDD